MRPFLLLFFSCFVLLSCESKTNTATFVSQERLVGTWRLLTGTVIKDGVTTVTDYTKEVSFIKIINADHFAFLQHDLHKPKDSAGVFIVGGGYYTLRNNSYTESLEYCTNRQVEGNNFQFTVTINNDTLVQSGDEKVKSIGVSLHNTEKYVRIK